MQVRINLLSGYPRVGKDEVANYLVTQQGYNRIAFADGVRAFLLALNPMIFLPGVLKSFTAQGVLVETKVSENFVSMGDCQPIPGLPWTRGFMCPLALAVKILGWDVLKEDPATDVRGLMQRMGTEVGRQMLGEFFWVNWAEKSAKEKKASENLTIINGEIRIVVPDWRFPNEGSFSPNLGGRIVRSFWFIERPGFSQINDHASETWYSRLREMSDRIINNDRSVSDLHYAVKQAMELDLQRSPASFCGPDQPVAL